MPKVYTTNGDKGFTKDYAGKDLPKDDLVILTNGKSIIFKVQ